MSDDPYDTRPSPDVARGDDAGVVELRDEIRELRGDLTSAKPDA